MYIHATSLESPHRNRNRHMLLDEAVRIIYMFGGTLFILKACHTETSSEVVAGPHGREKQLLEGFEFGLL